jgi:hypothetical protein
MPIGFMRDLTQECKRDVPMGSFQNQLEAYADLAVEAKMWTEKGCENLIRG